MTKYRLDKGKKIEGESIVRMKLLEIYGELFKWENQIYTHFTHDSS